jgi:energy-coupling factor transport system ATP-binding protein
LGLSELETKDRVLWASNLVGLTEDVLDKSPFEISGGQKRRAAIAGVLAMKPDVLVLDEPTAGLDPNGRSEILCQIKKLHNDTGITVILVSHGMEDIANTVDYIYVMNNGSISMQGTPVDVYSQHEQLELMGLDAPQITKLMKQLYGVNVCTVSAAKEYILGVANRA